MTVWKEPADVATTEALGSGPTFPASGVIDGVTLKVGDRVLVKDQITSIENGYYVVVESPPTLTLTATGETIGAEDVIRVSQGDGNAHTTWVLIDATNHIFARQDAKHYSFKSIDALKHLWQILPDATATVAGYAEPGDKGGGDFTFLGAQDYARVASVEAIDVVISSVTDVDGLVTITVTGHGLGNTGNITRAYIKGLGGLVAAAYYVKVEGGDVLTLPGYFTGVSFVAGAKIQYVKLITFEAHKRANGHRVSIAGIAEFGGAAPIARINDGCGVIDETTLSIPIETSGGIYKPGRMALIGDDALIVPATDTDGNFGGLWQRLRADHVDVRWFGARADWKPEDPQGVIKAPTDDLPAFNAAIAALGTSLPLPSTKAGKVVAEGFFYLAKTLHITKAVELVGAGNNSLSLGAGFWYPTTVLAFPANTTGIRVHSAYRDDSPDGGSGNQAIIRDLMIACVDDQSGNWVDVPKPEGHGIHASAPLSVENVNIENFWGNGINIVAAGDLDLGSQVVGPEAGSADCFNIINCNVGHCAGHGVYVRGYASVGLVARTTAAACQGWGFFDESGGGNTYIACHGESNLGHHNEPAVERSYKTTNDYGVNCSVFVGCYLEGGGEFPAKNEIVSPGMVLGGVLASPSAHIDDSSAFVFQAGISSRAPLSHINDRGNWPIQVEVGTGGVEMDALNVSIPNQAQYVVLRLNEPFWGEPMAGWLSFLHNGSRHLMQLPLAVENLRRWAPQFRQGIFYHSYNAPTQLVSHSAGSAVPTEGTWERGDLIWNDTPAASGPIGWVCTSPGTQGILNGGLTTGSIDVDNNPTLLVVSSATDLEKGQYITIGEGTDTYKVVKVNLPTIDIAAPGALVGAPPGAAIRFIQATFSTFGEVVNIGNSTSYAISKLLTLADRYVTVTATGRIMTLPKSPIDGQTHDIKSGMGVIATVNTEGGVLTIDGQASVTLAPGDNGTFRYSDVIGEWEFR